MKKSACLDSLTPSVTVTFHPEKSMIKAGKVCPNTDVKYIECHDPVSIRVSTTYVRCSMKRYHKSQKINFALQYEFSFHVGNSVGH